MELGISSVTLSVSRPVKFALTIFFLGSLADIATTYYGLTATPLVETNPILVPSIATHGLLEALIGTKFVSFLGVAFLTRLPRTHRREYTVFGFTLCGILFFIAAGYNLFVILSY